MLYNFRRLCVGDSQALSFRRLRPLPLSMIALIQRVLSARVDVENTTVGAIGPGLLALVAVQPGDDEPRTRRMLERLLGYRVFADEQGRMNRSLADTGGELLLVSQFTLAADTRSGMRPSFTSATPRFAHAPKNPGCSFTICW